MFSTGQWVFAIFFIVVFTGAIIFSYRKDKKLHIKHYKGAKWVLAGFILFIIILFIIKQLVKN